jgi:DNA-binding HxlR family transcriptional regulator
MMAETEHSQKNLAAIRTRLDQIESMQRLIVASNQEVRSHVKMVLEQRENAPEIVTILEDGPLLQEDIVKRLGKSQPTISRVLNYLHDSGLLVQFSDPEQPRKVKWGLNDLETTVNVTRVAKQIVSGRAKSSNRRSGGGTTPIPDGG